ncbi:hypothetical protein PVK06_048911 [Gossypium arboreum]|uniref:RNase H type-1 domain-containing protein n=1 Tax=Gossypium arboreum TaxID=29729 RepID=A0ABR0MH93_GOSAR|nr:hypothetical protein PVK06_048911 [Gossypium arboreum]
MLNKPMLPLYPIPKKWEPLRGTIKIKFDATMSKTKTGFGVTASDSEGFVIGGGYGFKNEEMTDYASLANRIKKRRDDITIMSYRINECFQNMDMFNNAVVNWAYRNCNKVADFMSNYAISNEGHLVFGMDCPTVIHNLIIDDAIN